MHLSREVYVCCTFAPKKFQHFHHNWLWTKHHWLNVTGFLVQVGSREHFLSIAVLHHTKFKQTISSKACASSPSFPPHCSSLIINARDSNRCPPSDAWAPSISAKSAHSYNKREILRAKIWSENLYVHRVCWCWHWKEFASHSWLVMSNRDWGHAL